MTKLLNESDFLTAVDDLKAQAAALAPHVQAASPPQPPAHDSSDLISLHSEWVQHLAELKALAGPAAQNFSRPRLAPVGGTLSGPGSLSLPGCAYLTVNAVGMTLTAQCQPVRGGKVLRFPSAPETLTAECRRLRAAAHA